MHTHTHAHARALAPGVGARHDHGRVIGRGIDGDDRRWLLLALRPGPARLYLLWVGQCPAGGRDVGEGGQM